MVYRLYKRRLEQADGKRKSNSRNGAGEKPHVEDEERKPSPLIITREPRETTKLKHPSSPPRKDDAKAGEVDDRSPIQPTPGRCEGDLRRSEVTIHARVATLEQSLAQEQDRRLGAEQSLVKEREDRLQAEQALVKEREDRLRVEQALAEEREDRLRVEQALAEEREDRLRVEQALAEEKGRALQAEEASDAAMEKANELQTALADQRRQRSRKAIRGDFPTHVNHAPSPALARAQHDYLQLNVSREETSQPVHPKRVVIVKGGDPPAWKRGTKH